MGEKMTTNSSCTDSGIKALTLINKMLQTSVLHFALKLYLICKTYLMTFHCIIFAVMSQIMLDYDK